MSNGSLVHVNIEAVNALLQQLDARMKEIDGVTEQGLQQIAGIEGDWNTNTRVELQEAYGARRTQMKTQYDQFMADTKAAVDAWTANFSEVAHHGLTSGVYPIAPLRQRRR